jgi:ParB family chromosome partitioning protein
MKLSTSLVAVKKINSAVPRSNFSDEELEGAAQLILEAEGVINPVVLRRTSLESYEVVDGDFEYYAAARAREIDPRKGEMIGAFIIEDENEQVIKEQVKLLRKQKSIPIVSGNTSSTSDVAESRLTNIESRQTNLESRFESRIKDLKAEQERDKQKLEDEIKELKSQMPKRVDTLEAFNTLKESDLIIRLRATGITGKTATTIIEKIQSERKKGKFESLSDVVTRIEGLSDKRMITIIDSWSRISFD